MSVKRNFPRFKRLSKFTPLLRPELRSKILLSFEKEKWQRIKRGLFPRKFIFYHQDVVNVSLRKKYFVDRTKRRKRIYRFLLRDRQRLQFYYGNGRIKYFQLKALALKALKLSKNNDISGPTAFLAVLEHRLAAFLYRLRFVTFLTDARPFVADGYVEVGNTVIKDYNFTLSRYDMVKFDPKILYLITHKYLSACTAFFYQKHGKLVRKIIMRKGKYMYLVSVNKEKRIKHTVSLNKKFVALVKKKMKDKIFSRVKKKILKQIMGNKRKALKKKKKNPLNPSLLELKKNLKPNKANPKKEDNLKPNERKLKKENNSKKERKEKK